MIVPESQSVPRLLESLKSGQRSFALVANEFGNITGIVTLHDVMQAIVGDMPSLEQRLNPEIKSRSFRREIMEEGCLSFPGEYRPIKRHKKVTLKALDRKGNEITIKADGMLSRAIQHETDHLDGVLFIDR